MTAFVDEIQFELQSGDGGAGSVSFRREKYVPRGGPDGGDGGKGGDVVFVTRSNLATLTHLRGMSILRAKNGDAGRGRRMHGKDGENLTILVPPGTRISDNQTGQVLHDFPLHTDGEQWLCLPGGRGGQGNWHFRSSRNRRPTHSQSGMPGVTRSIALELALIADVGLVGLPNAGKSTLINALTGARSPTGAYAFTTKTPHLGMLRRGNREVVIADIPGLIKGAAGGAGLGHRFLRHITRTSYLAYITDLGEADPIRAIGILEAELTAFDESLSRKKRLIIGTKTDLDEGGQKMTLLRSTYKDDQVIAVSAFARRGLDDLIDAFLASGRSQQ